MSEVPYQSSIMWDLYSRADDWSGSGFWGRCDTCSEHLHSSEDAVALSLLEQIVCNVCIISFEGFLSNVKNALTVIVLA